MKGRAVRRDILRANLRAQFNRSIAVCIGVTSDAPTDCDTTPMPMDETGAASSG